MAGITPPTKGEAGREAEEDTMSFEARRANSTMQSISEKTTMVHNHPNYRGDNMAVKIETTGHEGILLR